MNYQIMTKSLQEPFIVDIVMCAMYTNQLK